jgi:hypothetical protein
MLTLLCGFAAGLFVGGYTVYAAWQHAWRKSTVVMCCSGCLRFMGHDGLPIDGTDSCASADGTAMYAMPLGAYQGQVRDVQRFARAHGWRVQNRPFIHHLCPDCRERAANFTLQGEPS